jgi:hypothetical protein
VSVFLRFALTIPAGQGALVDTCSSVAGYDSRLSWGTSCEACNSTVDDFCGTDASITIPIQSQTATTTVYVLVSGWQASNTDAFTLTTQCSAGEWPCRRTLSPLKLCLLIACSLDQTRRA